MRKRIAKRERLPRWNLGQLFDPSNSQAIDKAFKSLDRTVREIERYKKILKNDISAEKFLKIINLFNKFRKESKKIEVYSDLKSAENLTQESIEFNSRTTRILSELNNRLFFFRVWWKNVDSKNTRRLISSVSSKDIRHQLAYMSYEDLLTEENEKIIQTKDLSSFYALAEIYDLLTTEMNFTLKIGGRTKNLTTEEVYEYFHSKNPNVRKASYKEFLGKFRSQHSKIISYIYQTMLRDFISENTKIRNHRSPKFFMDNVDNIPDKLIEMAISTIRKNAPVFQRYFRLKKKYLKLRRFSRYDIYAPFPVPPDLSRFTLEEARDLILESFYLFSPKFGDAAKIIFDSKRIDLQNRVGKAMLGFCASPEPGNPSYIHLHFQHSLESTDSLAHEMGHGVHQYLAGSHSIEVCEPSMFLTEISSIFSELIFLDNLFSIAKDDESRLYIMGFTLDNIYKTLMRQAYFAAWEITAVKLVQKEGITGDMMADEYMNLCREQFGKSMSIPKEFKWEWLTIPHFYMSPFYVYSYACNQILALYLFDEYKKKGKTFADKIISIISAGGSAYPLQILSRAGINVKSEEFWQNGFKILKKMIDEFERLSKKTR